MQTNSSEEKAIDSCSRPEVLRDDHFVSTMCRLVRHYWSEMPQSSTLTDTSAPRKLRVPGKVH
jgi:hypothetical protein